MPVTSEDGEPEPVMRRQPPSPTRWRLPRAEVGGESEDGAIDEESIAGSATPAAGGISEEAFSPKYFERHEHDPAVCASDIRLIRVI